nr:hypothetical protein [Acidimicrobiia bacterium]
MRPRRCRRPTAPPPRRPRCPRPRRRPSRPPSRRPRRPSTGRRGAAGRAPSGPTSRSWWRPSALWGRDRRWRSRPP